LDIKLESDRFVDVPKDSPIKETEEWQLFHMLKAISDVESLQAKTRQLTRYDLRVPFGRLSLKDLLDARELLKELQQLIKDSVAVHAENKTNATDKSDDILGVMRKQAEVSNQFYRLMPLAGFESCTLPIVDNEHLIQQFDKAIEHMLEFEVAGQLVTAAAHRQKEVDAYSYIQTALECHFRMLNPHEWEAQHILQYIYNSSSHTKVHAIFAVSSKSSKELFDSHHSFDPKNMGTHMYLWHGTKPENLLSILKLGLLPAPPSALKNGSLFGDGIYFADAFAKSVNYCTQSVNGNRFALLCEVDVSDMATKESNWSNHDRDLATSKAVLKMCGQKKPNPLFTKTLPTDAAGIHRSGRQSLWHSVQRIHCATCRKCPYTLPRCVLEHSFKQIFK
jgi:hypothetical protein